MHLLTPLEKNEQSMVKLDAIFKALGVETEKDVRLLAQYFLNHRQYKELIKNKQFVQKRSEDSIAEHNLKGESELHDNSDLSNASVKTVPPDSVQLVNQNEVVSALKTFVTLHHKSDKYVIMCFSSKNTRKFFLFNIEELTFLECI